MKISRAGWCGFALLALLLGAGGGAVYLNSAAFQARVAGLAARQIQAQLGLVAHYRKFHFSWRPLGCEFDGLVLSGRERAPQPALVAAPRVIVRLDRRALWHGRIALDEVQVLAPVLHLYPLADGELNLPRSTTVTAGATPSLLFAFQVRRLTATQGAFWLRDRRLPFAVDLRDLRFELRARDGAYDGQATFRADPGALGAWRPGPIAAQGRFVLGGDALQLTALTATWGAGSATLRGAVADFAHPAFQGAWQVTGSLAALGREWNYPELAAGSFRAAGQAGWNDAGYRLGGTFQFAEARLRPPAPPLATWSGQGEFSADATGVVLERGRLHGLASDVELSGRWRAAPGGGVWQAHAALRGLDIAALQPLLRFEGIDPRLRASLAALAARLAGSVDVQSRGADAGARLQLALTPDAAPGARLAAGGAATLRFAHGAVELSQLALQFAGTRLSAAPGAAGLRVHVAVDDVSRLAPVLTPWLATLAAAAPGVPAPGWGGVRGAVQLDLTMQPATAGAVFTATAAAQRLRWGGQRIDELSATLRAAPGAWKLDRLALRRGAQTLTLNGQIAAANYLPGPRSAFQAHLEAQHLALAEWSAAAGLGARLSGAVALSANLAGTPAQPGGSGRFDAAQVVWGAQALGAFHGTFNADRGRISIADFSVTLGPSHLNGTLRLDPAARHYTVALLSSDADLGEFEPLQSTRVRVDGPARVQLTGEGDWRAPQALLTVSAPRTVATWGGAAGLPGGSEQLGDVEATVRLAQGRLAFQLADLLPTGGLSAQGTVSAAAPHLIRAGAELSGYDFDPWLRRFTALPLTAHSVASGTLQVTGPLDEPQRLQAAADFDSVVFSVAGRRFRNQGAVRLEADPAGVRIAAAHFTAPQCDLTLGGRLLAGLPPGLDLTLTGRADLGLLAAFDPELRASGQLELAATLRGKLDQPQLGGTLALRDGSLTEADFPVAVDQIAGRVRLAGNRAQIESLTARAGGGALSLTGFATRSAGNFLVDLNAVGRDTRLRYLGISAVGNLDLHLVAQRSGALLAGSLMLNRIGLGDDFDLAALIANSRLTAPPTPPDSLLAQVRLDVRLATGPQLELDSAGAQLALQADLRLRGTLAEPSLIGQANAATGSVFFAGYRYRVDKGLVQFSNPYRIEPLLDLELSTSIPPYDVTLNVSGPADKLNITYRSDPPLSSADIVNLLATGTPTQATGTLSQQAAGTFGGQSEQLLGRALQNAVSGRLQGLFGITQVEVSPNSVINGVASNGSSVVIQQQVSRNLKLTYTENLSSSAQDIVQVEWTLTRTLGLTLSRDQFGLYGLQFELHRRAH